MTEHHAEPIAHAQSYAQELGMAFAPTEVGNQERFVDQHRDKVRYIPERKQWVIWNETRWAPAGSAQITELAKQTTLTIYDEAKACTNEEGRRRLTSWALQSQKASVLQTMIRLASHSPSLVANLAAFDRGPLVLNCRNGIVDLRTGELSKRTPETMVMKLAPVAFEPKAPCPTFNRFIQDIFKGDGELIRWVQRAIGYTLTGLTTEQKLFIAYGTGANGKSTLFEVLLDILGDYSRSSEFETFLSTDRGNTRVLEGVAKLQGVRYALASETDSNKRWSEAL